MPLYQHMITGNKATASDDYVSAFPEGTWKKLADESPEEEKARLQQEALENKVELEDDDAPADDGESEDAVPDPAPKARQSRPRAQK